MVMPIISAKVSPDEESESGGVDDDAIVVCEDDEPVWVDDGISVDEFVVVADGVVVVVVVVSPSAAAAAHSAFVTVTGVLDSPQFVTSWLYVESRSLGDFDPMQRAAGRTKLPAFRQRQPFISEFVSPEQPLPLAAVARQVRAPTGYR